MPDESAWGKFPSLREGAAQGDADGLGGEWGYCKHCQFLVPIVPVPYANAGCLQPHSAGKYSHRMVCGYEYEKPTELPKRGVIASIERQDIRVQAYVKNCNTRDPRED